MSRNVFAVGALMMGLLSGLMSGCVGVMPSGSGVQYPPIVFVHGNGDTAGIWQTTLWRFESNGWPRERLHALDMPFPLARDDDSLAQEGRSSTADQAKFLADEVMKIRSRTGAEKVVLIANSRGGYAVRNYIQNLGGAASVSHAVLSGVPNHGVWVGTRLPNSEFNGSSAFLTQLNAPKGAAGDEVVGPVKWLTLRSDNNDKFAQPDGAWIGQKGVATGVTFDGPALKGASNVVLPLRDHRETAFHPEAFKPMFEFVTGRAAITAAATPEATITLDGKIAQLGVAGKGDYPTNVALAGAVVNVFAVDAQGARVGEAKHKKTVGADGRWGPFEASPTQAYEFVVSAEGYAHTHIYRSPFARSSNVINMRPARIADADKGAVSVITLNRPRGYYSVGRDQMSLDGKPLPGIGSGVPGTSAAKLKLTDSVMRAVVAQFNGENITVRAWSAAENRIVFAELHQ